VVVFECSPLVIEIQSPANLWAWQNLGFAKTSVAHSLAKKLCQAAELTTTFDHHLRNFSIVCDSPKSAWNSQQCKTIDSSSRCSANTSPTRLIPKADRKKIHEYLFREGVLVAKKDFNLPKHGDIDTKNLYVRLSILLCLVWLDGSGD